jgi:hypothetical protein
MAARVAARFGVLELAEKSSNSRRIMALRQIKFRDGREIVDIGIS